MTKIKPFVLLLAFTLIQPLMTAQTIASPQPDQARTVLVEGRKLNLVVMGNGKTTVVLESGLGSDSSNWKKVQPEIARFTRVVAYDRAGYGKSEPGPKPRSAKQVATELHSALKAAGIKPPYILVGHSLGGPSHPLIRYCVSRGGRGSCVY